MIIKLTLVILAALCNATMDALNHGFSSSIFSKLNKQFWDPSISWKNKYKTWFYLNLKRRRVSWLKIKVRKPAQISDAWHVLKTIMILAIIGAMTNEWKIFIILGVTWNITFSLMYNFSRNRKPKFFLLISKYLHKIIK